MSENLSLYRLTEEIKNTIEHFIDDNPEISQEDRLNHFSELLTSKVDSIIGYRESQNDLIDNISKRISELQELKKSVNNRMDRFDYYIESCLRNVQGQKVRGEVGAIAIKKKSLIVNVLNIDLLPPEFIVMPEVVPSADKVKLKEALKLGEVIEGAELIESSKPSINWKAKL